MKRAFLYELKRNLLPLVIFSVITAAVCLLAVSTTDVEHLTGYVSRNSCVWYFMAALMVLCTVVPVMQFSYRMHTRSVDLWYCLPISRKSLTLVRTLVGLILVFVPYTLAYWLGVAGVAVQQPETFAFIWYLPNYFLSLVLGAGLFGVNAFLFTRANRASDGIVFMLAWGCALAMLMWYLSEIFRFVIPYYDSRYGTTSYRYFSNLPVCFFTFGPIGWSASLFDKFILTGAAEYSDWLTFGISLGVGLAEAVAAYVLLFVYSERDKAENAAQISSSWWGYRVLLPFYLTLTVAMLDPTTFSYNYLFYGLSLIGAFILYFAYRRSFRLKKEDIISILVCFVVGVALSIIAQKLSVEMVDNIYILTVCLNC